MEGNQGQSGEAVFTQMEGNQGQSGEAVFRRWLYLWEIWVRDFQQ
jgi:hypothetical protein